jgi:hypothetical protein
VGEILDVHFCRCMQRKQRKRKSQNREDEFCF